MPLSWPWEEASPAANAGLDHGDHTLYVTAMKFGIITVVLVFLLSAACCAAPPTALPKPEAVRTELSNGLVVIAARSAGKVASVQLWVRAGSVTEDEYMGSGISHLVEHMLFKGTPNMKPGEAALRVRALGGTMNAYTSTDRTVYHITLPKEHTEKALELLSDAAANPLFDPGELEKEQEVILREIDMNEDNPVRKASRLLWSTAFRVHPYRHPVIGCRALFETLTRDDVIAYHKTRYMPNNMIVVVAADIEPDEAAGLVEKHFGTMKMVRRRPPIVPLEPRQLGRCRRFLEWDVKVTRLRIGYHIPDLRHPDLYGLDVAAIILGHGQSSRLSQKLKQEAGLVHSISAWSYTPQYPGLFGINATLDNENLEPALEEIQREIERLKAGRISRSELEKAKRMVLASYIRGLETTAGLAAELGSNELTAGNVNFSRTYVTGIRSVKPKDVVAVARKYLTDENMTTVALRPRGRVVEDQHAARKVTATEKFSLSNGATLIVRPRHDLPLVSVRCVWRGGSLVETEDNAGIGELLSRVLTRGAPDMVKRIEERGGSVGAYSGHNSFGCSLDVLREDLDEGLSVLSRIVIKPPLPEDTIEKAKASQIASIRSRQDNVFSTAMEEFRKAFFGSHPYRFTTSGTEESVSRIFRKDLLAYHALSFVPAGMVVAVYGDVTTDEARALMERRFGSVWSKTKPRHAGGLLRKGTKREALKHLDRKQAVIILGYPGTKITSADRYILRLASRVLSGQGSRLWEEVREKRGLAYSVGSFNIFGIDPGAFVIYASVQPEKVQEVKKFLLAEMERLRKEPVGDEELETAKAEMIGEKLREKETNAGSAFSAALNELYGLGYDADDRLLGMIQRVTAGDIRNLALDKFLEKDATIVVVAPQ